MSMNRRDFLRIGGAGVGGAALLGGLTSDWYGAYANPVGDPGTDGDRVVASFCELCFWKCGILAHVKDGRVTKIKGNPKHPLSRGRLCPRGAGGTGLLYDPDRLKQPLVRLRKNGEQRFAPVSWDGRPGRRGRALRPHQAGARRQRARPLLSRLRRQLDEAPVQGLRLPQHRRALLRPVPRAARRGLQPHLRRGRRDRPSARTSPTLAASCSSARTWARTCTTPRCRTSPTSCAAGRISSSSIRASRPRPRRRATGCPSSRARTSRSCSPGCT